MLLSNFIHLIPTPHKPLHEIISGRRVLQSLLKGRNLKENDNRTGGEKRNIQTNEIQFLFLNNYYSLNRSMREEQMWSSL